MLGRSSGRDRVRWSAIAGRLDPEQGVAVELTEQWSGVRALEMRVAGEWVPTGERAAFGVDDPAIGEVVAEAPEATAVDVDTAVRFARALFDEGTWSSRTSEHAR